MRWLYGLLIGVAGCGGGTTTPDVASDGFDKTALLAHLSHDVLLPIHAAFASKANDLVPAIAAHCASLSAGEPGEETRAAAHLAWREAMSVWQRAEALLVGPARMDNQTLRSLIYAWPQLAPCELDRDTASRFLDPQSYDVSAKIPNARSLAAIEYLIFANDTQYACAMMPAGWDQLADNLPRARCELAEALAIDVRTQATNLYDAWRPDAGDFVGELTRAGTSDSSIPSAHEAVNQVAAGMFYVDNMVKDMKLGEPAGIAINACGTVGTPCLREVEHPRADHATFAIRENLAALRAGFTGTTTSGEDLGFDDYLRTVGHPDVADRMVSELDAAITAAAALPDSFLAALETDRDRVVAVHAAIQLFTADLKTQFLTLLALELPDDVPADND